MATVPLLAGGAVVVDGALLTVATAVAVASLCPSWSRGGRSRHSSGLVDALLDACDGQRYTPEGRRPSPASRCLWRPLCIRMVRGRSRAAPSPGEGARRRLPLCPCGAVAIAGIPLAATRSSNGTTSLRLNGVVRGVVAHTTPLRRPLGHSSRSDSRGARGDDPRSSLVYSVGREALGAGGRWQPALTGPQRGFSRFDVHGDENKAAVARCFLSPADTAGASSILQRAAVLAGRPVWPPSRDLAVSVVA